ncbi:peptidase domain-containing ABC transporter [Riemerella anatipestifer]|nr:peptidase domain-containing ABC transporter [Riemerella anatipestifer]AZZ59773.1 peptidase domain-containing ABC transporter [Riemerella anatipestifer]MBT0573100.1 peptidase domain-containing ABC transporter [Riemerella anatipestifer]QZO86980.1 peptidase domain-containing ABC transporter [Riemerella anatipestifer]QZO96697.1 peptidase domain-containing ABC transporter [Riemerella anatipestifer]WRU43852.1 peptidase domain-containing ABC transporter [Riemerella anatipestifer]
MDCGPACLVMIARHYGKRYPIEYLREKAFITREGVSLLGISEAAHKIGLETQSVKLTEEQLEKNNEIFPCILHWNQNHFVVLFKITTSYFSNKKYFYIADPAHGIIKLSKEKFKQSWLSEENTGVAMFLNPTEEFEKRIPPKQEKVSIKYLLSYLAPYRKQLSLMFLLLLFGSGLTLIFPFLTEALIDKGVNAKDLNFIFIILLTQLGIFLGSITIEIIRNWLMLYVGTHLSIKIISDFLKKMLQLPVKFFDTKTMGDFNQRIQDNERIESFLTSQSLTTFFSIITFSVFFGVLWYYDIKILLVYLALTILSVGWSFFWLKKRKILDYYSFQQRSENQESIYEMLNGVTEMKLNQFEDFKRKEWENIQKKLFKLNIRILKLNQVQLSGFEFLNQLKNILVTFLAANYVVKGDMTLGMLLSISYIIGQMNSPVNQLVSFFRSLQDAKLSLERLNEVQNKPNEEQIIPKGLSRLKNIDFETSKKCIQLKKVSFQYEGPRSPFVLRDINLVIPEGKITAIVGASGSGKTSLIKLLLRFYESVSGSIEYNGTNILEISPQNIRENCGIVMQDGYIFSDTIERNIATGDENIDYDKLQKAIKIANIGDFIDSLPLGLKTKIGAAGNGISGGQRQRILIARAVYKNPHYIFFDEATSALDAENEKIIHDNLQSFFRGKTVIIIAHRLSTVKNADQIVVLDKGEISELGTHQELVEKRGSYYNLVRNQLELGN